MGKVKPHSIDRNIRKETIAGLFEIVEKLKNKKEIVNFFIGLLTSSEALMLARRIQIAQLLLEGAGYEDIQRKLKVGSQTILRTDRWLNGEDEELSKWLAKIIKKEIKKEGKGCQQRYYNSLLHRYPFHRFWSDLLK